MKRYIGFLLVIAMIFVLCGCSQKESVPGPAIENDVAVSQPAQDTATEGAEETEASTEAQTVATEPEITGNLYLTASKFTFSVVGESEDIYCGNLPRDVVLWESADESIAVVDNGVVTAVGVGTTTVTAQFKDQTMVCEIGCLANDADELATLPADVLHAPKKIPPVGDGEPCHFYDDAAIIGDSISYALVLWAAETDEMGDATFLVRGGNGILGYVNRYKTINYQGIEMSIEDAVETVAPKKLFIMLGCNDLGYQEVEETMGYFRTLMERIMERCPDAEVYLESLLPVWEDGIQGTKNADINAYNELLEAYADEMGYHYVEMWSYIVDHTGGMAKCYSSDFSTHMTYDGIDAWMQALKLYAKTQSVEEN